jgi:ACT domain-containing protein
MHEKPGQIAKLSGAIAENGGNIVSFVTHEGDYLYQLGGTMKIIGLDMDTVKNIFESTEAEILDIRQGEAGAKA